AIGTGGRRRHDLTEFNGRIEGCVEGCSSVGARRHALRMCEGKAFAETRWIAYVADEELQCVVRRRRGIQYAGNRYESDVEIHVLDDGIILAVVRPFVRVTWIVRAGCTPRWRQGDSELAVVEDGVFGDAIAVPVSDHNTGTSIVGDLVPRADGILGG